MDRFKTKILKHSLIIPGAAKSGTSSLYEYLALHPQINMSTIKEPHFYSVDEKVKSGEARVGITYQSLFDLENEYQFYGEASTSYLTSGKAINNIKANCPKPKFIILLRHPIERTFSHYKWLVGLGEENLGFKEAIRNGLNGEFDVTKSNSGNFKYYLEMSKYGTWVSKYIEAFGRESILIITTEALKDKPQQTLAECYNFLGLDAMNISKQIVTNQSVVRNKDYQFIKLLRKIGINKVFSTTFKNRIKQNLPKQKVVFSAQDKEFIKNELSDEVRILKKVTNLQFSEWIEFL